jgi:glycosyltransferase involved in cell wall biosynthesis
MPAPFLALLSIVIVVRNEDARLRDILTPLSQQLSTLASDHELIVVDNGSTDSSVACLQKFAGQTGIANLQVYCLTKEVDFDTAAWAGIENALGDYVVVFDPLRESYAFLSSMIEAAVLGNDVVFAENEDKSGSSWAYGVASRLFHRMYRRLNGVDLTHDAPRFRLLSRRLVNFLMQHPVPSLSYRHLPATSGFRKANLRYRAVPVGRSPTRFADDFDRALRLIVSSTRAPMRLVTTISLFGAISNVVYSGYVIAIAFLKKDVAAGWVTLSLQQSGMFFLISLVLLVLGEYILHMAALSTEGPRYYVAQEFTSAVQTRRRKLNVEESAIIALPTRAKSTGSTV